jgi:hypothetical protein
MGAATTPSVGPNAAMRKTLAPNGGTKFIDSSLMRADSYYGGSSWHARNIMDTMLLSAALIKDGANES